MAAMARRPEGLAPWGLFMGLLAMAGLPIYIHAPRVYAEAHGLGLGALYAIPPLLPPLWWFALALTALFSAFSFLTICFYAAGVAAGAGQGAGGHVRLAGWREAGGLVGLCLAAVAPALLAGTFARPHAAFAWGFAALVPLAWLAMRGRWAGAAVAPAAGPGLRAVLADPVARRLLLAALVVRLPVEED